MAAGPPGDQRSIERVPVRVVVSDTQLSAPLGETRDISLDGFFLVTRQVFRVGDVLPVNLPLGGSIGDILADVEVMRVVAEGAGVRFAQLSVEDRKKLRRHVVLLTSVAGSREMATRLHDENASTTAPLVDRAAIRALLERTRAARVSLRLIPADRQLQQEAVLTEIDRDRLVLRVIGDVVVQTGEPILALYTFEYVSYSFQTHVIDVLGRGEIAVPCPERVVYSERRVASRRESVQDTWLTVPAPWGGDEVVSWQVLELSAGGLSYRVDTVGGTILPGTPLSGAQLRVGDRTESLVGAVVRHVRRIEAPGEATWLRVGVAFGAERDRTVVRGESVGAPGWLGWRLQSALKRLWMRASFLFHRRALARVSSEGGAPSGSEVVHLKSRRGLPLVGLLDVGFADEARPRGPLVIVLPGFGGRKEQMSFLASILVEGFRRNHGDVAVLRIDGSNNLGESFKDPGCEEEGRHNLHYTLSGVIDDLLGSLDWARSTPRLEVTEIVVVSVSFASCAVMHALAGKEAADVSLWISYMGAADVRDAVLHVSGHSDLLVAAQTGTLGLISLIGCMTDTRHFWKDVEALGLGSLDDARRDMAQVRADVTWFSGLHDGWMDPRRVRDIMGVKALGNRQVVDVDSGHVPRTSDEAVRQFVGITLEVWRHVHGTNISAWSPSVGRLEAVRQLEWARTKRSSIGDRAAFWRRYLLGATGGGFDVLTWSPAYNAFMSEQAELLDPAGADVLELGAGTGNLALEVQARGPASLVCVDIVAEALVTLRAKFTAKGLPVPQTIARDLEGTPLSALARWRRGELRRVADLARRVPGVPMDLARRLDARPSALVDALLRGTAVDLAQAARQAGIGADDVEILSDLQVLARVGAGRLNATSARESLRRLPPSNLDGSSGLPFPDASFDAVAVSIVLSYLSHPEDLLSEIWRVLRPGGRLVLSSMKRDADTSQLFMRLLDSIPPERADLRDAARDFLGEASSLFRLEEEGLFRFYDAEELVDIVSAAGFEQSRTVAAFGEPGQAVVVRCQKP